MLQTDALESAIREELARIGTSTLEELASLLPDYSWAQVFVAVDRLTRDGTILKHSAPFLCLLSLAPCPSVEVRHLTPA